jgi:two-component sensor histidine kinase
MALIHEELHKGEVFETLNFSSYVKELTKNLLLTYRLGNYDINLNMDLDQNVFFDMDTSIPLGIIINELVSNSLKHAFPDQNDGELRIKLHREEGSDTSFILTISDNGVGIPIDIKTEELDSLGLQLVTTLVDQLDGELELKRDNGTEFIIRFTVI